MKRYEISIPSSDGKTTLHGFRYDPDGPVRGVVQLVHGMEEYIGRYEDFAAYLAENGYVNDINDSRMHHEIYLSDPRKSAPNKWKTVIRHPIRKL